MTAWAAAASAAATRDRSRPSEPVDLVSVERSMMGGRVGIHLRSRGRHASAARDASAALARLEAWAARLTRFDPASELSGLNASSATSVGVGPTLAAVLDWGRAAEAATGGLVDVALLDARLAAEREPGVRAEADLPAHRQWSMARGARTSHVVRPAGLRFDLDGVAKGWLADRACALLRDYPAVAVDADGDVAIALDQRESLDLGIADPADPALDLAVLRLRADGLVGTRLGVATSGTSVHRWGRGPSARHHLIDPRTGRPAETDVEQATVIAPSARLAEALAKAAVILGSRGAVPALGGWGALGAILLLGDRRLVSLPGTGRFRA